ncbi:MAG: NuoI/complex I 23 kDa subunit family protein [bacterium]|jgi:formate hydrogenlyase subunit 6/NADH:ubiquinone oxidoreductase subunit I
MIQIIKDVFAGFTTTLKGMVVTGREFFQPSVTVHYPYEKRVLPDRFRGMLVNDCSICIACDKCVKICPVNCLHCEAEGKGKSRHAKVFTIDYIKCCWCNLCVEVCPVDSLYMSHDYETVFTDRSLMIRDFVRDPIPPIGGTRKEEGEDTPDGPDGTEKKKEEKKSELSAA